MYVERIIEFNDAPSDALFEDEDPELDRLLWSLIKSTVVHNTESGRQLKLEIQRKRESSLLPKRWRCWVQLSASAEEQPELSFLHMSSRLSATSSPTCTLCVRIGTSTVSSAMEAVAITAGRPTMSEMLSRLIRQTWGCSCRILVFV